jgi:hypothetical protein
LRQETGKLNFWKDMLGKELAVEVWRMPKRRRSSSKAGGWSFRSHQGRRVVAVVPGAEVSTLGLIARQSVTKRARCNNFAVELVGRSGLPICETASDREQQLSLGHIRFGVEPLYQASQTLQAVTG